LLLRAWPAFATITQPQSFRACTSQAEVADLTAISDGIFTSGTNSATLSSIACDNLHRLHVWIGNLFESRGSTNLYHIHAGTRRVATYSPAVKMPRGLR
jgi:hypothetical protein